jgi:hypothetical protein
VADIKIEPRQSGNLLPWIIGLVVLAAIVAWLIWQNNQHGAQGLLETSPRAVGALLTPQGWRWAT